MLESTEMATGIIKEHLAQDNQIGPTQVAMMGDRGGSCSSFSC